MRADRLLSILMILQARGRVTAERLATELEVSERTIYRDLTALSAAGVPVYAERGPGGGCALIESYRTNLTGLTSDEARALFMLSVPSALEQLGMGRDLKAARLKLAAALPAAQRQEEEHIRQRILLDSSWWFQGEEAAPHLPLIQQAVWEDRQLWIKRRLDFNAERTEVICPYALVAKASVWYVVGRHDHSLRAYRVSRILEARILEDHFQRPEDFDLANFWREWCEEFVSSRPFYPVRARLSPQIVSFLWFIFGDRAQAILAGAAPPDEKGWITATLPFETFEAARQRLLSLGRAVEILEPEALRCSVKDFAQQIVAFYQELEARDADGVPAGTIETA